MPAWDTCFWQHSPQLHQPRMLCCHQVRCMYWGHLGHFHRAISHLKHNNNCTRYLGPVHLVRWNHVFHVFAIRSSQAFPLEIYCSLNIEPHCLHVYVCQCWPERLEAICRNGYMGFFHAVSTRENISGVWDIMPWPCLQYFANLLTHCGLEW